MSGPPLITRVPSSTLFRAVAALMAPVALIMFGLVWQGWLEPGPGLAAFASIAAAILVLVYRHLTGLATLRDYIERLAHDPPPASAGRAPAETIPVTAEDLARAVSALDRSWARRGEDERALMAANEAILEAIPDPLLLLGAGRIVTRTNAAARALFGADLAGRDLAELLRHPDVIETVEEGLAGRENMPGVDLVWPGSPERHFNARVARLQTQSRHGGALLLVLNDVTALKHAEKMRADFVANVSHELRTPLSALLGFTETLRGAARDDAPARERFLGIMHEQAQRMTRLVRDLLSLSRIEESEHTPPTDRVEIARVIGSVLDTLALQTKARNIAIDVETAPDLPPLEGDADQLAQVFQNLIDNAIKYCKGRIQVVIRPTATPPARVAATVSRRGTAPARWLSVAVADDGEGIPREHLPRLTERFYRVDAARSRQMGGTGLGLAIVKHILNRHRGALTVDSEPGRGSVFTVWLPAG